MTRLRTVAITLSVASILSTATPASAGSVWDPNEPIRRLDIRWVDVTMQADGVMRVTMTFYHPLKSRWFDRVLVDGQLTSLVVGFTHNRQVPPYFWAEFFLDRPHGLSAILCEGGSGCIASARATRPNATTIRVRLPITVDYGPISGWFFRAWSEGRTNDRTRWSVV